MKFEIQPEPLQNVNATPDEQYPLRILRSHRQNQDCRIATSSDGSCDNPLFQYMNECSEKRVKILDKAVEILEKYYVKLSWILTYIFIHFICSLDNLANFYFRWD